MKKTVPFQKKITFDNEIFEINSIALEHQITSKENHEISGVFIISGDYKLIHSDSLNSFEYKLPFDISVDYRQFATLNYYTNKSTFAQLTEGIIRLRYVMIASFV